MHKFFPLLLTIFLSFSSLAIAQQFAAQYDAAANAYQQQDYNKAERVWSSLAADGDANSQYAMAIMHLKKEAQTAQDNKAFSYLVDAAKQQHVAAMFNLGVAYWEGRGVKQQTSKALNWWEVAAKRGDAGAQYNLGLAYHMGEGRDKNEKEAIRWIQQAIHNGHPQAKSLLASIQKKDTLSSSQIQTTETASSQTIPVAGSQINSASTEKPVESIAVLPKTSENAQMASATPPAIQPPAAVLNDNTEKPTDTNQTTPTTQLTELRAAPNINAVSLATIKIGTALKTLETVEQWSKVVIDKSYPVWVYEAYLTDEGKGVGTIKGQNVNIRPSPSTDIETSPALGQLSNGERVAIVQKNSPWVKVIPTQAFPAWVATKDIN